jgi:hypothetical protein
MTTRTRRWTLIALAAALLLSCVYQGARFDYEKIPQIQDGVTTQDDVLRLLGQPFEVRRVTGAEGMFLAWVYRYIPARGEGAVLEIVFNSAGRVHSHAYKITRDE